MSKELFKSTIVVSSMTLLSRILGFIRDMLIGQIFGVSIATDAFFLAFKIPNLLRRLFAEGAFAQAFIPVLADYKEQNNQPAVKEFVDKTAGTLTVVLFIVTVIGVIFAPLLILLFAPGFSWHSEQHELAAQMLRITFPYLLFISLVAFAGALLNSYNKFAIPAVTPVLLNICMITAILHFAPLMSQPIMALAWGVFVAGIAQLLFQIPSLKRLGLLPRFRIDFQDSGVKQVIKLMLPAIFAASVTQINLLLNTLLASFLISGSISWLYYSDRLLEFPLGILGMALGTVILPSLSKTYAAADKEAFSQALDWGLRFTLLIGVPASLGLGLLAEPILSTLFQYHEFSVHDVQMAGKSLTAYALGLVGFMLIKILAPGFTARKDMKTPVRFGVYSMLANLGFGLAFIIPLAHTGLALATSLGAILNAALLLIKLMQEKIYQPVTGWLLFSVRLIAANSIMVCGLYFFVDKTLWYQWSSGERVIHLSIAVGGAILVYSLSLFMLGFRPKHVLTK